ncbi:GNAT family N-acetyltransferase [Micromonospora sp. WMMD998]|uniref:GNAT family N-acetyltransferase n=1 Tax=Micromonospora sp. WMMD998 TaxID=3016092 RepID=UPI00249B3F60|nr:GNAT family N-acetyltransferase [Micromonospora sp. WMMD998]WFE41640.1 GNAT family N-acetyltransferase [Micromonospora sp. WMMD998]
MPAELTVRPATLDDDPDRIFDLLWQLAPSDDRPAPDALAGAWRDLHAQPGRTLLLAFLGPRLVGTVDTLVAPNLTHGARPFMLVENVVVDHAARRQGVAAALMRSAVDSARSANCYKIQLVSNHRRVEAHRFYESAGFTPSATGYRRYL